MAHASAYKYEDHPQVAQEVEMASAQGGAVSSSAVVVNISGGDMKL